MIPNIKLIVLLREPVSRAYSEYQMKKRRVDKQNEFISLAVANQQKLFDCLSNPAYRTLTSVTECWPIEVSSHDYFPRLWVVFSSEAQGKTGASALDRNHPVYVSAMSRCFNDTVEDTEQAILHLSSKDKGQNANSKITAEGAGAYTGRHQWLNSSTSRAIHFQPIKCLGASATETVKDIHEVPSTSIYNVCMCLFVCIVFNRD